ncbi:unnamed protein product [Polarella glacialis]|uniref:Enoyl reductase (ER) domain-containing protein n=1 Tax=Polarella glacialis TaxID=89957 RepID=A0A813I2R9_POLGL|nr:unnamed protein product [Polarella glacialis]
MSGCNSAPAPTASEAPPAAKVQKKKVKKVEEVKGYAATKAGCENMAPISFTSYTPGDEDISFDIKFCGMCHTDVHFVNNDLENAVYPLCPGHELIGTVTAVGSKVTNFKLGDNIGVGCLVDACLECGPCGEGYEQYCEKGMTMTYGYPKKHGRSGPDDGCMTMGGYSNKCVVHKKFGVKVPAGADLPRIAPLLCAGVTVFEPLVANGCKEGGKKIGIVGLGGLGMMGIKLAAAMGNAVTAISTSSSKEAAAKACGATSFVVSSDAEAMKAATGSLDLILDTVAAQHEIGPLLDMLNAKGKLVLQGLLTKPVDLNTPQLLFSRKCVTASLIGGMPRTQEMMDICMEKKVFADVEVVSKEKITECLLAMQKSLGVVKRFVIDCSTF